jgi:hypothetical protein
MSNDHRSILQRGLYDGAHRARVNAAATYSRLPQVPKRRRFASKDAIYFKSFCHSEI